jgi:GTP cyclohydrolase I
MDLRPRTFDDGQLAIFEGYAKEIFSALGMSMDTPSTVDTPRRFIKALIEATEGYDGDHNLIKTFDAECHGGGGVLDRPDHPGPHPVSCSL